MTEAVAALQTKSMIDTLPRLIDARAMVDPSAKIGKNVAVGPWTVIGPEVEIGDDTTIAAHVVIERNVRMGRRNQIHPFACIGGDPQDLNYRGEETWLDMGDDNVVREYVTLNRGSAGGAGVTRIGNKNTFLTSSHVAHDCQIANEVLFTNHATVAGHVTIENYAIMGAFTAVHQFTRIGAYSFLSRATEVGKDIPPFMLVANIPGYPCGLNLVGLRRRGFSNDTLRVLKNAYKIMYRSGLRLDAAVEELKKLADTSPEVQQILDFIKHSERGIARRSYEE